MAPEVCLCKDYGLSADVYSYGILFWNVMSAKTPFNNFSREKHFQLVVKKDKRPNCKGMGMPANLRKMMKNCWSSDRSSRPSFEVICDTMQLEISSIRYRRSGINQNSSNFMIDRSGHLLDVSQASKNGFAWQNEKDSFGESTFAETCT